MTTDTGSAAAQPALPSGCLFRDIGRRLLDGLEANKKPGGNTTAYWAAMDELQHAILHENCSSTEPAQREALA